MIRLSDDQLNNLNREALIILVSSLQDQLTSVQEQLDVAKPALPTITGRSRCLQNRSGS